MNNFDFSVLTSEDILYAALGAVLITWVIKIIMKLNKIIKNPMSLLDKSEDLRQVIQRCYKLFPMEIVQFNGETYKRGMKLKIITMQKKIFEGEFIGCNEKNMLCILTSRYIIAHEMTNIQKIEILDKI
ncbi:MAG: hypothetical protein HFE59_04290 [Clostridiales bacterium]|nr:hypothetical protein [Clostridiales bacterium]